MDDPGPNVEWKGEEYPFDEGNQEYRYGEDDNRGKMSWIWNKGLGLGTKILFGGAVVSSAPLFLPPLVVISVLGVALSVPYGILLGSYACTEKLMSKLLPPPANLSSGYGSIYYDDDEGVGYGGGIGMEREENELEGTKARFDTSIESGDEDEEPGGEGGILEDYRYELEEVMEDVKAELGPSIESVDKEDEELGEGKGEVLEDYEPEEVMENFDEEEKRVLLELTETFEGDDLVGAIVEEVVMPCLETSILVEEQSINEVEEVELVIEEDIILERSGVEEVESPCQVTSILIEEHITQERVSSDEEDEIARETTGLLERIRDEGRDAYEERDGVVDQDYEDMEPQIDDKCAYISGARMDKPIMEIIEKSDEDVLGENEKMREAIYTETIETILAVEEAESESPVSSRNDMSVPSSESQCTEEKIWEQIRAMRTIVGHKGAIHATCMEELKALYIFTGIEPPASFQDSSDLVEVNEKLQFLMAIIGVK